MPTALTTEPCASTTAATRPNSMSEQYSGDTKRSPIAASGGAKAASTRVPTQPATNEPTAAMLSAAPARPRFAI